MYNDIILTDMSAIITLCIYNTCDDYPTPDDPMKVHSKYLKHWHSFYNTYGDEFDPSSATLLELGGGPTIHSLISACQHVSKITFSDYADTNRREIQLWNDNDPKCKRVLQYRVYNYGFNLCGRGHRRH